MTFQEMFCGAKWVSAGHYQSRSNEQPDPSGLPHFPVLRGKFTANRGDQVTLRAVGLGFFHCYINGNEVTDRKFLPLSTDYAVRQGYPKTEILTGHRLYVPQFDISALIQDGENTVALYFGGGWYTFEQIWYGFPKAIYDIFVQPAGRHFGSSDQDKIGNGFVTNYFFSTHENHDYTLGNDRCFSADFDDSGWQNAVETAPLETEYLFSDCPCDAVTEEVPFALIGEANGEKIYRCDKNISGYPVLRLLAGKGEKIQIAFDETIHDDFSFTDKYDVCNQHTFMQTMEIIADGTDRTVQPLFTWFGFQYFKIRGNAVPEKVLFVGADVQPTADFKSDNETLNWLYRAFLNTQLCNLHAGIPSDCPHFERRGYTGDAQLVAPAAMKTLDMRAFYRKWMADILDSQDRLSGHTQYVVPLAGGGGGPGGWGCAILELPYQYYKHYGDLQPFREMYPGILHWFEFMNAHSVGGIVTSDLPDAWCLGEWVTPDPVILPAGFVNTYFYIRSMKRCLELMPLIGADGDIPLLEERIKKCTAAFEAAYYSDWNHNYIGGVQGANAFALDIGLGTPEKLRSLCEQYTALGHLDTGIFGTEILPRMLFQNGENDLAYHLLTNDHATSFEAWRKIGATTLGENWLSSPFQRSFNHPMFGAVVSHFFTYLLGIGQPAGAGGYTDLIIAPHFCKGLDDVSGSMKNQYGVIAVGYHKADNRVDLDITIPPGTSAVLTVGEQTYPLNSGENQLSVVL